MPWSPARWWATCHLRWSRRRGSEHSTHGAPGLEWRTASGCPGWLAQHRPLFPVRPGRSEPMAPGAEDNLIGWLGSEVSEPMAPGAEDSLTGWLGSEV